MKRKLPPFPALRAFEASARLGSFKAAADELCVTPSAISHQVRVLETFLGRAMFIRAARDIRLTEEGRKYQRRVGPLLDQLDASTRLISAQDCTGALRVKSTEGFCKRWLVPRLPSFMARYPDIRLTLSTGLPPTDFSNDAQDIVIHWGDKPVPGVVIQPFMSSERMPVCSPDYLATHPDLKTPHDLQSKSLIFDKILDGWSEWFENAGIKQQSLDGPIFDHCELGMTAAENGLGVALAYKAMIGVTLAQGRLVAPFDIHSPTRTIYSIAYPEDRSKDSRIIAFRDWLFDEILEDSTVVPIALSAAE